MSTTPVDNPTSQMVRPGRCVAGQPHKDNAEQIAHGSIERRRALHFAEVGVSTAGRWAALDGAGQVVDGQMPAAMRKPTAKDAAILPGWAHGAACRRRRR